MNKISVIIINYNSKKYLQQCLNSIFKNYRQIEDRNIERKNKNNSKSPNVYISKPLSLEIIVVDNNSTDGSVKFIKSLMSSPVNWWGTKKKKNNQLVNPSARQDGEVIGGLIGIKNKGKIKIKLIENKENVGPAKARNIGVKQAQGEILFFLDVDTEIQPGLFPVLTSTFQKRKRVAAAQAKLLLGKTGKIDTIGHFLSPLGFPYEIGHGKPAEKYQQERLIFAGRTAALAIRRQVFQKIGGFDEDYFIYAEDTDLCWRVWLAGYQVLFLPKAIVYHRSKSSLNQKTYQRIFFEGAKNQTSNIIKNTPFKTLLWLLPLHLIAWSILSLKLIFQGRFRFAGLIWQGLGWNLRHLKKTLKKRREISSWVVHPNQVNKIIFGKIKWTQLVKKGWRWFQNV